MPWNQVDCHPSVRAFLLSSLQKGMLSGTHLLHGPAGAGQLQVGRALVKTMNCQTMEHDFCGACNNCRRIEGKLFPDVFELCPENDWSDEKRKGRDYSIGHMRAVQRTAQSQPYEAERKIFLLDRAERLNLESANCLLKILEEPYSHALFILLTENINRILPTILSRCRKVRLSQLPTEQVAERFADSLSPEQAETLARASSGYPERALQLQTENYLQSRDEILSALQEIKNSPSRLVEHTETWSKDKNDFPQIFRILTGLLRDGLVTGTEGIFRNPDQRQALQTLWRNIPAETILKVLDALFDSLESMERYTNTSLILFDSLAPLFGSKNR